MLLRTFKRLLVYKSTLKSELPLWILKTEILSFSRLHTRRSRRELLFGCSFDFQGNNRTFDLINSAAINKVLWYFSFGRLRLDFGYLISFVQKFRVILFQVLDIGLFSSVDSRLLFFELLLLLFVILCEELLRSLLATHILKRIENRLSDHLLSHIFEIAFKLLFKFSVKLNVFWRNWKFERSNILAKGKNDRRDSFSLHVEKKLKQLSTITCRKPLRNFIAKNDESDSVKATPRLAKLGSHFLVDLLSIRKAFDQQNFYQQGA